MVAIRIEHLTKVFPGDTTALDDLTLTVGDGQFFALLGPSGCGKTTLLRTVAGLEQATSGSVRIGDRDVTSLAPGDRDVAMVFQDYALFPHMSVTDNVAYPLRIKKVPRSRREGKAAETAASLGLDRLMSRRPGELSGGQQQRVALARAMVGQPSAFLFDEPLSNLDARLRLEARTFLKRLQRELGVTTIFVTHDQAEALAMADQIAVMESGRIRQVGTPTEVFHRPANTFVANFIGSTPMNMVPGRLDADGVAFAGITVPRRSAAPAQDVIVGFRPEYTKLEVDGPSIDGEVEIVENLGATMLVTVMVDEQRLQAVVPEGEEPAVGGRVRIGPDPRRMLVYDSEGALLS